MDSSQDVTLADGVLIEQLGAECVVFVPGSTDVLTLTGEMATAVVRLRAGEPVSASDAGVAELVDLGVVSAPTRLTRRRVLTAGAVGVGAGVAALAMPSVAGASSPSAGSPGGRLVRGGGWTKAEQTNNPEIQARLNNPPALTPTDISLVRVFDPPYPVNPAPSPTLQGSVTVGGVTYSAFLIDYKNTSNIYSFTAWFFLGASTIATDDPFVLTYTFGGISYTVTP